MNVIRSLWASVQGDPVFMRRLNGHATVHWLCHFPVVVSVYFFLPDVWEQVSILYLALVSIYANVAGHLSAWQASRVEVVQDEDANVADVLRIVKEIRARTDSG